MAKITFLIQREDIDPLRTVQRKILFPVESAFAGALLKEAGHVIQSFDLNLQQNDAGWDKAFRQNLNGFNPDFVVSAPQTLSFLIKENRKDTKTAFQLAKKSNNRIKTIYCGPFATSYPEEAIIESDADYLIRGEYDRPLLSLVNYMSSDVKASDIPGVISRHHRSNNVHPVHTDNLDTLPFPAYSDFNYKAYFEHPGRGSLRYPEHSRRYTHYQTSRGCPFQCCFCNVSFLRGGRRYRCRSVGLVLNDMETLTKKHGIEEIHFLDENLTVNPKRTVELCRGFINRKLDFKWIASGGLGIYSLDRETLEWMWKAGCYRLNLALESGSQEVLDDIIKKPVKLERDLGKLEMARDIGFELIGYFVIGLPGETRSQIMQTIELAGSPFFDYIVISIATPQAGTGLEEMCKEKGLIGKDVFLPDISRRSTGVYSTEHFSLYDLEEMRWKLWDRINFSNDERKNKICEIMGISPEELSNIRMETEYNFKRRWETTG